MRRRRESEISLNSADPRGESVRKLRDVSYLGRAISVFQAPLDSVMYDLAHLRQMQQPHLVQCGVTEFRLPGGGVFEHNTIYSDGLVREVRDGGLVLIDKANYMMVASRIRGVATVRLLPSEFTVSEGELVHFLEMIADKQTYNNLLAVARGRQKFRPSTNDPVDPYSMHEFINGKAP